MDIVYLLLSNGADVNVKDENDETALIYGKFSACTLIHTFKFQKIFFFIACKNVNILNPNPNFPPNYYQYHYYYYENTRNISLYLDLPLNHNLKIIST